MNTLTGLIPSLYKALDIVSRELVGFIPSVFMDADASRAAVGQQVLVHVAPASAAEDIVPGQLPPDTGDQTIGNVPMLITKSRAVPFRWSGEEQKGVNNSGPGYKNIKVDQMAQAMRTLCNEVESDLGGLIVSASRAFGTPGTTPFATDLEDVAQMRKILVDNGSPESDLKLVIDTTAGVKLRKMGQLTKANEAGGDTLLRQGILLDIHNFAIRESAGVKRNAIGTGTGFLVNNVAGYPVGATAIAVDTGTGTILAGDYITFAGDAVNKYMVTGTLAANIVTIGAPGLRVAIADNNAISVGAIHTSNAAFHRNSFVLLARAPALPEEGDAAVDRQIITDPRSGLSFEVAMYLQYRRVRYEIGLSWGVKGIKEPHASVLLG